MCSFPLSCTCTCKLTHSPSLKHLNSSHFKTVQQLFSRPLYNGLDNISITCGKFNELNLSRVSAFASRAANTIALFFRGWIALCLAEGSGFGSSCPGPSVGTVEASLLPSQLANSALETRMSQRQYVADRQRKGVCAPGSWESQEHRCCLLPSAGRGEGKLQAPPKLPAAPAGEIEHQRKRLKSIKFVCLKASRKSYLLTNYTVPTLVSPMCFF